MKTFAFLFFSVACGFFTLACGESLQRSGYSISADTSLARDSTQIAELTDSAISSLATAFPDWNVPGIIKAANLKIVIHAVPTPTANDGTATLETGGAKGAQFANLEILAPSRHPADARTNVGENKDAQYFQRLLIHEISTLVFEGISDRKAEGWRFHSAPSWFVQGLEQYVAFRQTSAKQSLQLYIDRVRQDPKIVQSDFGLQVSEPYIGGAVVLAFMDERYGWESIQKILLSPEPTFGAAMRKQLGVTADTFAGEFRRWVIPK